LNKKIQKVTGTIAALASARGMAGISVIRVSGPQSKEFFSQNNKKNTKTQKRGLHNFLWKQ